MAMTNISEGHFDNSLKGMPLILTLPKKDGGSYQKRVYDKGISANWDGPGHYEIKWSKNDKGFFDIVGLTKKDAVTNPANGSKTFPTSQYEKDKNFAIMASVALKEAVAAFPKSSIEETLKAADAFHAWLVSHSDPEFHKKEEKAAIEVVTKAFPESKVKEEEDVNIPF